MFRIALLTHGFDVGGGVPTVARWLRDRLVETGEYRVDIHDLATSRSDHQSRLLTKPQTWGRRSLLKVGEDGIYRWGANAVEMEFMRYRSRAELTSFLEKYDILQLVTGTPAWANAVRNSDVPAVLQTATMASMERQELLAESSFPRSFWTRLMTRCTSALDRRGAREVRAVMVENQTMLEIVHALGQSATVLAPPGIDTDFFRPAVGRPRTPGPILSLCRLADPRKRLDRLVEAYAELVSRDAQCPNLVIAGRGQLSQSLRARIGHLGLSSRVSVLSDVPQDELVKLYQDASVFVQTSQEEGLGISLLQAMACGVPVVATETAGSLEAIPNRSAGLLVPQESEPQIVSGLAQAIQDALADRLKLGASGREFCVATFSNHETIKRYLAMYKAILSARRDGGPSRSPQEKSTEPSVHLSTHGSLSQQSRKMS